MWVLFRLLTALLAGVLKFFWRRNHSGERQLSGGTAWVLRQARNKGRVISTTFGIPFEHPLYFRLVRENWLDRFFKSVDFTREIQTGDPEFDRIVYVSGDHLALAPVLQADAGAREAILSLFRKKAATVFADGNYLWAHRSGSDLPDEATLAELVRVRDALLAVPAEDLASLRDPFFWRALVVQSLAWSVACYGFPVIIETVAQSHLRYFDWSPIITTGLLVAVGLFIFLFALAWQLLRGSSRTHRVLTESALLLLFGVPLTSIELVSDANIALDRSAPIVVERRLAEKYTDVTRSSKGRTQTHYHLRLVPAAGSSVPLPPELEVSSGIYQRATKGGIVTFTVRSGALGFAWLEEIRPRR